MPTPYDAPIPGAPGYATAALGAKTAYQNALARINSKRQDTLRRYGYLGDIDKTTGVINNVRVDPYNQYGGLQQLLRGNAGAQEAARFAAEERGLHGGLAHKMVSDVRYDLGDASQRLGSAFAGALGGFQDEQNQAGYDRDRALYEAELEAARYAIEHGNFNQANYDDTDYSNPSDNGNSSGAGSVSSSPTVFVQKLINAGVAPALAPTLDPGIAAAVVAKAAAKKKTKASAKVSGGRSYAL